MDNLDNGIDRRSVLRGGVGGAVALAAGLAAGPAQAKELAAGFVINKENYDSIKGDTFEGKTIASMVPEKLEWMIKNYNLTIKLANSKKIEMDRSTSSGRARTSTPSSSTRPTARSPVGKRHAVPADKIDPKDPHAGDKIIWNLRAATYGATMDLRDIAWAFLDAKTGYERVQAFQSRRYYMEGRLDGGPITVGDGTISQKTYFVATYPQDIRGLACSRCATTSPTRRNPMTRTPT